MELKEIKDVLDGIKGQVAEAKDANVAEIKSNIEALEGKMKEANENSVKAVKDELLAELKLVQDHADKLDVKMQSKNTKEEKKSFADSLLDILGEKKDYLKSLKETKREGISMSVKAAGTMTLGNYSGGVVGLTDWDGSFARIQRRSPYLRQLVSIRPVSSSYVAWAEQAIPDGGAGNTAEGALKTQADFDIVEASKKVEKITAFIKVSKEALDDISFLSSEIRTELLELINLKLDADILGGSGTTPVISGLLSYAQAFSVAGTPLALGVEAANNFDVARAAAWQVASNNFQANYMLVNPVDAAKMDLEKATDGHYIMPPFSTQNGQSIAGLTVVENNGVTAGSFLVGDFSKSNLGIREEVNINVGYENDDFTKNLVTILAEVRAVHYVKSNHVNAFVTGTFAAAKTAMETI